MGVAQSLALPCPRVHLALAEVGTPVLGLAPRAAAPVGTVSSINPAASIDFEALIDPSFTALPASLGGAGTLATTATTTTATGSALPTDTAPPHFLFTWGDSYTSNGFDLDRARPSQADPEGVPGEVGWTTTGPGRPNWIEVVTASGPLNTLNYDFAYGGAAVDNRLTRGANAQVPDFVAQSRTFLQRLATPPRPAWAPWDARNSEFIVWFGRNDVYWTVLQNDTLSPRLDDVVTSYFHIVDALYAVGARRFLFLGIPPMWREPAWSTFFRDFAPAVEPATRHWTSVFTAAMEAWRAAHPRASVTYFDPQPVMLGYLNNPQAVGAPDDVCNQGDAGAASGCLWADSVHPGEAMSAAIGDAVSELLSAQHFYEDSMEHDGEMSKSTSSTSADKSTSFWSSSWSWFAGPADAGRALGFAFSAFAGLLSSPKGTAWW